jgi:hypothetical protein
MKSLTSIPLTLAVMLLAAFSTNAQTSPGNILAAEFQTPKPGMTQQYEQGRKQKADWHKQQKDPLALLVFEIRTGQDTGTYLVSRGLMHWADMDHPSVPETADDEEYNKVVGAYVEKLSDAFYEFLPKFSNPENSPVPPKYSEILILRVKFGKAADFLAALGRISQAEQKANPSSHVAIYELANGGFTDTYVASIARPHWADFEANPNEKPMAQVLAEAYGPGDGTSILAQIDSTIETEYTEILEFRPDLSYIPGQ